MKKGEINMNKPSAAYLKDVVSTSALVISIFALTLVTVGCSNEISKASTYSMGGMLYQRGSEKPYTGYVIGESREGYRSKACIFRKEYKDGVLNGQTVFWYKNGKVESVEQYKDGKLNGVTKRYYPDGSKKAKIHFVDGYRGGGLGESFWDREGHLKKA
jgi:antitoxin component YwqK of YwqJK toxin-antitoxin module